MLFLYMPDQPAVYRHHLQAALPGCEIAVWPETVEPDAVTHAAVWAPPPGLFAPFRRLTTIFNLGAGVDQLLAREDILPSVDIVRLTDAGMAPQMTEYCLYGLLHFQREMDIYHRQQQAGVWQPRDARLRCAVRVGILGLGELGGRVATDLARMGYPVRGWSRTARRIEGVMCFDGEAGLDALLAETDVLFCVLPSTEGTRHLLDARRLGLLPAGAAIINAGRGTLIDEVALGALLDREQLRFALLDVFATEPLSPAHPFWQHPRVMLTPHIAADTVPEEAVRQIAENIRRQAAGLPMQGVVDRQHCY